MVSSWPALLLFMGAVLCLALYGLAASGQFPADYRADNLKGADGAAILWGSMLAAVLAAVAALAGAWMRVPWSAAVIGGGAMLLFAPLLLRPFPDSFVNGRSGLLVLSVAALAIAAVMWRVA
jgi:hypothetical protein